MGSLKLGALVDERPVKLTVELPAPVHRDLVAYAVMHGFEYGIPDPSPERLVAPMLAMFMGADREFAKSRKSPG